MKKIANISYLLETLCPRTSEELGDLQTALVCAEFYRGLSPLQMNFAGSSRLMATQVTLPGGFPEFREFLTAIPQECLRFFHGLVEALEVYRGIHGEGLQVDAIQAGDPRLIELRHIRDLCLDQSHLPI